MESPRASLSFARRFGPYLAGALAVSAAYVIFQFRVIVVYRNVSCFGSPCPKYELRIHANGLVEFQAENTPAKDAKEYIGLAGVKDITGALDRENFASLQGGSHSKDGPVCTLVDRRNFFEPHEVTWIRGGDGDPRSRIGDEIDRVTGVARWLDAREPR